MKDKLGREIIAGDTLAYATHNPHDYAGTLKIATVISVAPFAIQLQSRDAEPPWVIENTDAYVICAWAK